MYPPALEASSRQGPTISSGRPARPVISCFPRSVLTERVAQSGTLSGGSHAGVLVRRDRASHLGGEDARADGVDPDLEPARGQPGHRVR